MRTKIITGTILALALSSLHFASGQELHLTLFMESLVNGKTDTVHAGVSLNGFTGCDFDPLSTLPYYEPVADTSQRLGAFIVPAYRRDPATGKKTPVCNVFFKEWIGMSKSSSDFFFLPDLLIVMPSWYLPVKVTWAQDSNTSVMLCDEDFQNPLDKSFMLNTRNDTMLIIEPLIEEHPHYPEPDSLRYQTFVTDTYGNEYAYHNLFLYFPEPAATDESVIAQQTAVQIIPNPATDRFACQCMFPIQKWEVYDISGKIIRTGNGGQNNIYCQDWENGVYIFRWESATGQFGHVKFIKK